MKKYATPEEAAAARKIKQAAYRLKWDRANAEYKNEKNRQLRASKKLDTPSKLKARSKAIDQVVQSLLGADSAQGS